MTTVLPKLEDERNDVHWSLQPVLSVQDDFQKSLASFAFKNCNQGIGSRGNPSSPPSTPRRSPRKPVASHKLTLDSADKRIIVPPFRGSLKREFDSDDELELKPTKRATGGSPAIGHRPKSVSPSKKVKRGYAEPSTYAHLHELNDFLEFELDVLFCGINPGQKSAELGHHFANPTNHFWACLHESGLTSTRLKPQEDHTLPEHYNIGLTNLVDRPTAEQSEVSKVEFKENVPAFLTKVLRYRPRIVCFVGLSIADTVQSYVMKAQPNDKKAKAKPKASVGILPFKLLHPDADTRESGSVKETIFYAVSSTSGRVVHYQKSDKILQFKSLKDLLDQIKTYSFKSEQLLAVLNIGKVP